jgi:hypothetical protein
MNWTHGEMVRISRLIAGAIGENDPESIRTQFNELANCGSGYEAIWMMLTVLFWEKTDVIMVAFAGIQWVLNRCKRSDRAVAQSSGGNSVVRAILGRTQLLSANRQNNRRGSMSKGRNCAMDLLGDSLYPFWRNWSDSMTRTPLLLRGIR